MDSDGAAVAALKGLPYFKALDDAELSLLARTLIERAYEKDQVVFLEGEPCQGLYVVRKGSVKIFKMSPEGREQTLSFIKPGDSFNEVAVFDGGPNPANVSSVGPTTLWILPRDAVEQAIRQNPQVALAVIRNLGARLRHLVSLVEDLSLRQVTGRLAKLLLDTASSGERALTQQEMAAQLGTVREMIGRSLRELEARGLVKTEHGRIIILDREGLERLV